MSWTTSEPRWQYFVIEGRRCPLCQFRLEDGELVIVREFMSFGKCKTWERLLPAPFEFRWGTTFDDQDKGIRYRMGSGRPYFEDERGGPGFHWDCYQFKPFPVSQKLLAANKYSVRPSIREERRRADYVKRVLATKLASLGYLGGVWELCREVSQHLVREFAVVAGQERARSAFSAHDYTVDLGRDIYAHYLNIDGIRYVRRLWNGPRSRAGDGAGMELVRLHRALRGLTVRHIYVGYDHVGVRYILFVSSKDQLSRCSTCTPGLWWKELATESGISMVRARADGVKLRGLVDPDAVVRAPRVTWPSPGVSCRLVNLRRSDTTLRKEDDGLLMNFFDCNKPDTVGYSVALTGLHMAGLYTHDSNNTSPDFYAEGDSFDRGMKWFYMPMDRDERITEIWTVRHKNTIATTVVFLTNRGRARALGNYHFEAKSVRLHRLFTLKASPSRIYFNRWPRDQRDWGIRFLGMDGDVPSEEAAAGRPEERRKAYPASLIPAVPAPAESSMSQRVEPWYYSTCRLENVVEIACCIGAVGNYKPITGMLVEYAGGHRECVGYYRLDKAARPFRRGSGDHGRLRIGMGISRLGHPYVVSVGPQAHVDSNIDASTLQWRDLPWHGRLEWWASPRWGVKLCHSEKRSRA